MRRHPFLIAGFTCALAGLASNAGQAQLFQSMHAEQDAVKFSPEETRTLDRLQELETLPGGP